MRAILVLLLLTGALAAVPIVALGPVTGAATGSAVGAPVTPLPLNDNDLSVSANSFAFGLSVNSVGGIAHPLLTSGGPGVTEYMITVGIQNNLAVPITAWTFRLPGTPYDFDFPNFDSPVLSSLGWAATLQTDTTLRFQGGSLAPGGTMVFTFPVDVPAGTLLFSSDFEVGGGGGGGDILPEPSTWALVAGAALMGAGRARQRLRGNARGKRQ